MFTGKTVLITGGTRGIGAAITRDFLAKGANIIATYAQNREHALSFEAELQIEDARGIIQQADVGDYEAMKSVFESACKRFGRIDILVNNAGIRRDSMLMFMDESAWNDVLRVNLCGTFICCKLVLKQMIANRWGRIINIVSPSALLGRQGQVNYAASKGGVVSLTKSLAKELGKTGITVNAVSPGVIETDMTRTLPPNVLSDLQKSIALRRLGLPEDVSSTVLYLASEAASYITGQIISVDGGLT